jgi:hypothetical protein
VARFIERRTPPTSEPPGDSPSPDADRADLIGRLHQRADAEWLAELLIDLEEDEPARLRLVAALRGTT